MTGVALGSAPNRLAADTTATRDEIDLNGAWDFTPLDGGANPGVKTTIRVPDAWDAQPGFYDTTTARYEKVVNIPSSWVGRAIVLEIYEANWHVDLTVNSTVFPRVSEGIGVPTNIDITSAVGFGQNNTIKITVTQAGLAYAQNRPSGTFRWGQNLGLTGDVYLRSYPRLRVADAFVQTSTRQQQITVAYEIRNELGGTRNLTLEPKVLELDGNLVRTLPTQNVSAGAGTTTASAQQSWTNPHLWYPHDPHLYYLETTLRENGNVVDVQRTRFGFREVWTQGSDLLLNGIPVVLFADSNDLFQHAFMNYYYELWYDEATTRATVEKFKLARNAIRIHQAPAVRPHVLDVFDEEGILVISESAMYGGSYSQAGASQSQLNLPLSADAFSTYVDNAVQWIPKWIRRERNHPSIIIWSAENELGPGWLTQSEAQIQRLGDAIRALDATRPVIFEGDHACCGSDFNSLHYNQDGPNGDWPTDNDVYRYAQVWWSATRPNSQNEYGFTGWHGNGIDQYTSGSSLSNLTSMQGARLRVGLLTRGYRYQGWATLAPHTSIWQWFDYYGPDGRLEDAFVARSFMPVAAFDVEYDRLGDNPQPPTIASGASSFTRNVVVYNQETGGSDSVTLIVEARADGAATPFYTYSQSHSVARGRRKDVSVTIQNLPSGSHWIQLELKVVKDGVPRFAGETRDFWRLGSDAQAPAAPTGLRAEAGGGSMGVLDRNMVYLTWDVPNPRGDIASWVIYRGTSPHPTTAEDEVKLWGEREKFDNLNEVFDVVPGAGTYYYRIAAKDIAGNLSAYSNEVAVTVTDFEGRLRDPGFEMESRLYKNASNQYYSNRTWGARWPLPAILGGPQAAPHGGRYAGLINGDGAHAQNAFVDKFVFIQNIPPTSKAFHLGGYVRVDKVWRKGIIYDPNYWIPEGLRLAAVGGDGWFYNTRYADIVVSPSTLQQWEGDGQWHYIYATLPAVPENFNIIAKVNGEGDNDPIEPLLDAFIDDIVLTPLNKIPPVALASADVVSATASQTIHFSAAGSFAFNTSGAAQPPNTGLSYAWDFGDGRTSTSATPALAYAQPGDYVARLIVTDAKGLTASAQVFVAVAQPADHIRAQPAAARLGESIVFSIVFTGLGQPATVVDTLPAQLDYVSSSSTCPADALTYTAGTRQVTYSGTPTPGTVCTIDITTQVSTAQTRAAVNTAVIDNGVVAPHPVSATVILNGFQAYLPVVRKGF